jgi:hypothetical protein
MDSKYDYFDLTELNDVMKKFNDGELLSKDIRIIWTEFELTEDEKKELKNHVQEVETDFKGILPLRSLGEKKFQSPVTRLIYRSRIYNKYIYI